MVVQIVIIVWGCHRFYDLTAFLALEGPVPHCLDCGKVVKPDVTLYEEALDMDVFSRAARAIRQADLLIIGGTSLVVYPAASLINYFQGQILSLSTSPALLKTAKLI